MKKCNAINRSGKHKGKPCQKNDAVHTWVDDKLYCGTHIQILREKNPNAVGTPKAIIDNGVKVGVHVPGEGNTYQEQLNYFDLDFTGNLDEFTAAALPDEKELIVQKLAETRTVEQKEDGKIMKPDPLVLIRRYFGCDYDEYYIVAGTGSRELQKADGDRKLAVMHYLDSQMVRLKNKYGDALIVMSGMAEGFDKALAISALNAGIKLWCVIPNKGYGAYYWGKKSLTGRDQMAQFNSIVDQAWKVTYVMEDIFGIEKGLYFDGKHSNLVRNDVMVEFAQAFYVYDPSTPGTGQCFASIKKAGLPFVLVNEQV